MVVNGYIIMFNAISKKYQVCDSNKVLNEFADIEDAISWAEEN